MLGYVGSCGLAWLIRKVLGGSRVLVFCLLVDSADAERFRRRGDMRVPE